MIYKFYEHDVNKYLLLMLLKLNNGEEQRLFLRKRTFVQKNACFDLKVSLFVEKRKNKFAYELK
jgi:hypothetical protein